MDKKSARKLGLNRRSQLNDRKERSDVIQQKVISQLTPNMTIGCYVSMKDEVSTEKILQYCFDHNIRVAVPKTHKTTLTFHEIRSFEDLLPGVFGVREPNNGNVIEPSRIDWMIVPLSSFDSENNRTGYGKGYYDSILKDCRRKTGIAFSVQEVDAIETDPWDVPLDEIITEQE